MEQLLDLIFKNTYNHIHIYDVVYELCNKDTNGIQLALNYITVNLVPIIVKTKTAHLNKVPQIIVKLAKYNYQHNNTNNMLINLIALITELKHIINK